MVCQMQQGLIQNAQVTFLFSFPTWKPGHISSPTFRQNPQQWQVFSDGALLLNWLQMPQWELLRVFAPLSRDGSVEDKRKDGQSKGMQVGNLHGNSELYIPWYTKFPTYFSSWDEEWGLTSQFVIWIFQFLQKDILVPFIWILFVVSAKLDADYLIGSA